MKNCEQAWVIDDDKSIRWVLEKALTQAGIQVSCFDSANSILAKLNQMTPKVIVTDIRMPGMDGLGLLEKLQQYHPQIPVIIMTAYSDLESAVSAYQGGAFEYLPKPFDLSELVTIAGRAISETRQGEKKPQTGCGFRGLECPGQSMLLTASASSVSSLSVLLIFSREYSSISRP